ncbi:hypothetical protein ACFYKX_11020 [Cytobacillus sp. FJAT-54145]|uniref:Uncharacterized protein n=1 Tax=Cytobacillus spartinae TaxID=3299023 RepID=A0ABW6KA88_9BACI
MVQVKLVKNEEEVLPKSMIVVAEMDDKSGVFSVQGGVNLHAFAYHCVNAVEGCIEELKTTIAPLALTDPNAGVSTLEEAQALVEKEFLSILQNLFLQKSIELTLREPQK